MLPEHHDWVCFLFGCFQLGLQQHAHTHTHDMHRQTQACTHTHMGKDTSFSLKQQPSNSWSVSDSSTSPTQSACWSSKHSRSLWSLSNQHIKCQENMQQDWLYQECPPQGWHLSCDHKVTDGWWVLWAANVQVYSSHDLCQESSGQKIKLEIRHELVQERGQNVSALSEQNGQLTLKSYQ